MHRRRLLSRQVRKREVRNEREIVEQGHKKTFCLLLPSLLVEQFCLRHLDDEEELLDTDPMGHNGGAPFQVLRSEKASFFHMVF